MQMLKIIRDKSGHAVLIDPWTVGDIQEAAEQINVSVSEEDAEKVMEYLSKNFDSNTGINWEVVQDAVNEVIPSKKKTSAKKSVNESTESDYSSLDRFFCGKPTASGKVITEAVQHTGGNITNQLKQVIKLAKSTSDIATMYPILITALKDLLPLVIAAEAYTKEDGAGGTDSDLKNAVKNTKQL